MSKRKPPSSMPDYKASSKRMRRWIVKTCDVCGRKAKWSFVGRDGKAHGACSKHLKEIP